LQWEMQSVPYRGRGTLFFKRSHKKGGDSKVRIEVWVVSRKVHKLKKSTIWGKGQWLFGGWGRGGVIMAGGKWLF